MKAEHDCNKDKQGTGLPPAILEGIRRVTQQVVEQFHPQKVILFGSYAYGQPTEDSDVDLLVVMDIDEPPLHMAAKIAATIEHPFPLDIVVRTSAEFAAAVQRQGVFATEVATKGVTLYEAGNAGVG
ncbi:MAG: nucleotidyltransferase domain-containing protein [Deltaproteobacteria bacterium]|nr:nucleotidyltransferase domain-containing protein [Deltaproteobacteria bacterium]